MPPDDYPEPKILDRLMKSGAHKPEHEPLNYIQALGMSKDSRAAAAIKPYYEKYKEALQAEAVTGIPEDVVFGPVPYSAYLTACAALMKTDGSPEYEEGIRKYLDHPNEQVRWWAERALEIQGPTSTERTRKFKNKYGIP